MHPVFIAVAIALYAVPAFGAATPVIQDVQKYKGQVKANSYIVKLKDNVNKEFVHSWVSSMLGSESSVTHDYDSSFFHGFAGVFTDKDLNSLRSSKDVAYIAEDGLMTTFAIQTDAPWGLNRISTEDKLHNQDPFAQTYIYTYDDQPGKDVDIYVVDTGIFTEHPDFQGRARWGKTFGGYADHDGNGHGTHCAGIAGSLRYGVAKAANLIAVKVLNDSGSGATSDIVSGLQWVVSEAKACGRASIVTMSLGGGISLPLDEATTAVTDAGIHCTIAAGNSNADAASTSPAHVPSAITVGATDITETRAYYSNYGAVLDIFAPVSNIASTWNDGQEHTISGTSMATPHVAGLVASFISQYGNKLPDVMSAFVRTQAVNDKLSDIPLLTTNALANNGY